MDDTSYGHYMLLLRVTGVDEETIDRQAQEIHDAYMREFAALGAMTVEHLRLGRMADVGTNARGAPEWTHAIRYFGPAASVAWLQTRLETVSKSVGGEVTTMTFPVRNITGRY